MKIKIIKGFYGKRSKISYTTFPLIREPSTTNGVVTAVVDASAILGNEYSSIEVTLEDYKIL